MYILLIDYELRINEGNSMNVENGRLLRNLNNEKLLCKNGGFAAKILAAENVNC